MSWVQRYLKGFRVQEDLSPGLFERPDGSTWVRLPDGSAVQLPGGGSQPVTVTFPAKVFDNGSPTTIDGSGLVIGGTALVSFTGTTEDGEPVTAYGIIDGDGNLTDGVASYTVAETGTYLYWVAAGALVIELDYGQQVTMHNDSGATWIVQNDDNSIIYVNPSGPALGFFGVHGAPQQVVPLTTPTVQDVIDALVACGLIAQHD